MNNIFKQTLRITSNISVFSSKDELPSAESAFLNNEVYWYAEIAGSSIPHPIEWCPNIALISKDVIPLITINGEKYENYVSIVRTKENTTLQFGESTTITFTRQSKQTKMLYKQSDMLKVRIKDFGFIINIIESGEIDMGGNAKFYLSNLIADTPFDIESAKIDLELYLRIDEFWRSLQITQDFNIGNINSNSSLQELKLLMKSINGKRAISINTDGQQSCYLLRKAISNFNILFFKCC